MITDKEFLEAYNDKSRFPTLKSLDIHFDKRIGWSKDKIRNIRLKIERYGENYQAQREQQNSIKETEALNEIRTLHETMNKAKEEEYKRLIKQQQDELERLKNFDGEEDEDYVSPDKKVIHRQNEEIKSLKKALEATKAKVFDSEDIREFITGVKGCEFDTEPKWLTKGKQKGVHSLVPMLFLTDIHMGEVVSAKETGYGEDYNTEICIQSCNQVVEDFIDICTNKMTSYHYSGCVLMLGGDNITNSIHDLAETNDSTPVRQVIDIVSLLIQQIEKLHRAFGKVAVMAVTGNHGRFDTKHNGAKTKQRTEGSMETIVYHFVQQHFRDNKDVSIVFNESDEVIFGVNGRKFNLQHGDRVKGGGGIGGVVMAVKRTRAKLLQNSVAAGRPWDTLVLGHFHQHFIADDVIIGSALKPYDEYCRANGFAYNEAGATSFFVNSHGDIIYATHLKVRQNKQIEMREKSIELF